MMNKDNFFYNTKRNVIEEHSYEHSLQDVAEPNLFREIFDYDEIPKVSFNFRSVPMNVPENIWVTDTTFRDGQQATAPFSVENIVTLFSLMHKLGGPKGIIRQSEFFLYTEKDRTAARKCMELGYEFPQVTSWIRANEKDFALVKEMGVKETGILVSCSDYHIFKKMNLTRKQALDKYLAIIKAALEHNIIPRCHFEDITRADFYGFVIPFAIEIKKLSDQFGMPIKIRACDTMGYGVTYPGASLPRSVPGIIYGLNQYADIPHEWIEWHGHNDFYKVVTNATTAWLYGASGVNCSLLGIGERTGNCPLEAMLIEYASLKGSRDGMNFEVITEIADYFENALNYKIPPRTPFVGRYFNATRAGIHADGLLKNEEIYNIFNTQKILNRPAYVAVDVHSGLAGLSFWINSYYEIPEPNRVDKKHPLIEKMKNRVDALYADGRTTVMADEELDKMVQELDIDLYNKIKTFKSR